MQTLRPNWSLHRKLNSYEVGTFSSVTSCLNSGMKNSFETSSCPKVVETLVFNSVARRSIIARRYDQQHRQHQIFVQIITSLDIPIDMMLCHVVYCLETNISSNKLSFNIWIVFPVTMYIQTILFKYNSIKCSHKTKTVAIEDVVNVIVVAQFIFQYILDMIILIKEIVWMCFQFNTAYSIICEACCIMSSMPNAMIHSHMFDNIFDHDMIQLDNSHTDDFIHIYTLCIHDPIYSNNLYFCSSNHYINYVDIYSNTTHVFYQLYCDHDWI